ncbi:MAG: DHH family phosphoesterase, partial [Christensenellales bacterium]
MISINKNENLIEKKVLDKICEKFNLSEKVAEILINRGYDTPEKVDKFLNDDINNLKDPFLMLNVKQVVERIEKAVENHEKILIFGDYDVDGICATSIMYNYLITKTEFVRTYIPNRFEDGYGLSCPAISKIAKKEKPDLIITVDCGISCEKEVEFVRNMGIDIVVTDHHVIPQNLPRCLIVNPKFQQAFDFDGLCGAGVAFKI